MTLLIRFVLISIIIYLIIRSFNRYFEEMARGREREQKQENTSKSKGVSKEIGEYTDYEEVD